MIYYGEHCDSTPKMRTYLYVPRRHTTWFGLKTFDNRIECFFEGANFYMGTQNRGDSNQPPPKILSLRPSESTLFIRGFNVNNPNDQRWDFIWTLSIKHGENLAWEEDFRVHCEQRQKARDWNPPVMEWTCVFRWIPEDEVPYLDDN